MTSLNGFRCGFNKAAILTPVRQMLPHAVQSTAPVNISSRRHLRYSRPAPDAIARSGRSRIILLLPGLYHVGPADEFAFTDQIPCIWRINQ